MEVVVAALASAALFVGLGMLNRNRSCLGCGGDCAECPRKPDPSAERRGVESAAEEEADE